MMMMLAALLLCTAGLLVEAASKAEDVDRRIKEGECLPAAVPIAHPSQRSTPPR